MKNYRSLSHKQLLLTGCLIALLGTVAVVPWRVVAQEAKRDAESKTQTPAADKKAVVAQTPEQLIVGTWHGGPSTGGELSELLIQKNGDYVWLSGIQAAGVGGAMSPGSPGIGGGGRGGFEEEGGPRGRMGGGLGFRGAGMRMRRGMDDEFGLGSKIGNTPFTQQSGHWKLGENGTLLLTVDTRMAPSLRGLTPDTTPLEVTLAESDSSMKYQIIRLDTSLLRLKFSTSQTAGGLRLEQVQTPAIFFRRVDDQEKQQQGAAALPPDLQRLANLAHFNAEETKIFGDFLSNMFAIDKDHAVELINRIVAARQQKIDFAQLFKLTPEEATAYLEVLKLAGQNYSVVNNLAVEGQLSPTELAAVEKLRKFRTEYKTLRSLVHEKLNKLTEEYNRLSQPSTPEDNHLPADPQMLTAIRMLTKFETLLLEFDDWLQRVVFNS